MSNTAVTAYHHTLNAPELTLVAQPRPEFEAACFMPELADEQDQARVIARTILEANMQTLRDGKFDDVLPAVDPLGTASLAIKACETFGHDSPEYSEAQDALQLDCHRLYLEAFRAKTWEYFPKSKQYRDAQTGSYLSHGFAIAQMTENGLSPISEKEEQNRRVNEHVEELTYMAIGRGILQQEVEVVPVEEDTKKNAPKITNVTTISQCTNWALRKYEEGGTGFGGYVPSKNRLMIRNVSFEEGVDYREEDQLGLPGDYFDEQLVADALWILDNRLAGNLDRTEVHGTQIVSHNKVGVWDYAELLDTLASEKYEMPIFLGEVLQPGQEADYVAAEAQAAIRYKEVEEAAMDLASDVLALADSGADPWVAEGLVGTIVDRKMKSLCEQEPERARDMYDDATAIKFHELKALHLNNDLDAAQRLRQDIEDTAPAAEYCGAGSCGLESVDLDGSMGSELKKELGIKDDEIVVRDVERSCGSCGKKGGVVYAFQNLQKSGSSELTSDRGLVKKFCEHCKAKESKIKKVGS